MMHLFLEGQHYKILKKSVTPRTDHSTGILMYFCICNFSLFFVYLIDSYPNRKKVKVKLGLTRTLPLKSHLFCLLAVIN